MLSLTVIYTPVSPAELISDLGPRLSECIASCGHALHRAIQENREDVSLARDMAACVLAHINGCV